MSAEGQAVAAASALPFPQTQPSLYALQSTPPPLLSWLSQAPGPAPRSCHRVGLFVWTEPLAVSRLQKREQDKAVGRDSDRNMVVCDT